MKKYKCIKGLSIPLHDEMGDREYMKVEEGSVWKAEPYPYVSIFKLSNDTQWVEVHLSKLRSHFEVIK